MHDIDIPKVSIIILTFNSSKTIDACLRAIWDIDYPREALEVLVLDNGSTDNTLAIVKKMKFRYFIYPKLNISQLRNKGVELSIGDIIGFIDSDCIISRDWVLRVVVRLKNPSVGVVGNEYKLPDNATYFENNWYKESNCGVRTNDLIPAGNMAMRRVEFLQIGGFDDRMKTGEDDYLVKKYRDKGYLAISDHRIESVHLGNAKNLRSYFKKEIWYGLGMLGTVDKNNIDKPFFVTLFYLLVALAFMISIVSLFVVYNDYALYGMIGSGIGLILVPFLASLERVIIKQKKGNILYVTIAFTVFFCARIVAIMHIAGIKKYYK